MSVGAKCRNTSSGSIPSYGPLNRKTFEKLGALPQRQPPLVEKALELELKVLPSHL